MIMDKFLLQVLEIPPVTIASTEYISRYMCTLMGCMITLMTSS